MPRVLLPPKDLKAAALREALLKPEACTLASNGGSIELPTEIVDLLLSALDAWCRGHGVTVTVQTKLLTTQQAAELIGCSRQHVVSLMDSGSLPGHSIGTHRRIRLADVLSFIQEDDKRRDRAMTKLVQHTEEMGGYEQNKRQRRKAPSSGK